MHTGAVKQRTKLQFLSPSTNIYTMNKQTKLILNNLPSTSKVLLIAFLIAVVQLAVVYTMSADKGAPRIEVTPAVEVLNKHNNTVQIGTQCPRTYSDADPIVAQVDTEEGAEYQHCPQCRMGVYFKRPEGHLECSYCNHAHNG